MAFLCRWALGGPSGRRKQWGVGGWEVEESVRWVWSRVAEGAGRCMVCAEVEGVTGRSGRGGGLAEGRIVDRFNRGEGTEGRGRRAIAGAQAQKAALGTGAAA